MPVLKAALADDPHTVYNPSDDKRYTLFCGTEVLQTRAPDHTMV